MKKKKLSLNALKVNSFITQNKDSIKGGGSMTRDTDCFHTCSEAPYCGDPIIEEPSDPVGGPTNGIVSCDSGLM